MLNLISFLVGHICRRQYFNLYAYQLVMKAAPLDNFHNSKHLELNKLNSSQRRTSVFIDQFFASTVAN